MRAGQKGPIGVVSVSPLSDQGEDEGVEINSDDGEVEGEVEGELGERVGLPREDENVRKIQDPVRPCQGDVELHYLKEHIPFRSWCPICVKAFGREMDHKRDEGRERKLSEYSWDYCFPGDELGFKWTVLVGKERKSQSVMASAVPMKGFTTGKFTVDKCLEFIDENGDREMSIVVKTDQEPSIEYVVNDLVKERSEGKTIVEESPKKSSGSNGVVERGVQEIEGRMRAIFLGLQERMERELDARERIVAFIPEYAAYLENRLHQGQDGMVAYERIKGKKPTILGVEFGEKVMFKKRWVLSWKR